MEASVVGKTFWAGAVASLGEHDDLDDTLWPSSFAANSAALCTPPRWKDEAEFGFWHALVRDVAYAELTRAERARMHARTARWIADRTARAMGEDAEIVVHHLDAALEFAPSAPDLDTEPLIELLTDSVVAAGAAAMRTDVQRAIPLLKRAVALDPGG